MSDDCRIDRNPLDTLRLRGIQTWALTGWLALVLLLIGNAALQGGVGGPLLLIGCLTNIGPTWVAIRGRYDTEARTLMGSLAAVNPAMLVFLLRGHPWQMDAHMYFFVGMAALVVLADWRPIVLATVLTAIHHLALEWLAPEWVFSGSGNVLRVVFHIVAIALQCGALTVLTIRLERLFMSQDASLHRSRQLIEVAEDGRRRTEEAMEKVHAAEDVATGERREREEQALRIAAERRGEFTILANEFERSVTSVVKSIGQATEHLEDAAVKLDEVTVVATQDATEVALGAGRAASDIGGVAGSIRVLSEAMQTIATTVNQQTELSMLANKEAERGMNTIAKLEEHAIRIESFLNVIGSIAHKTNLLSLNATIEAARAGDAGRGFAVVANEIKSLSADTRQASEQIRKLVTDIREGVADTDDQIRSVNCAIDRVSAAASGIATAIHDQRSSVADVDAGADRTVGMAGDIECRIGGVARAIETVSTLTASVRHSASRLAIDARDLRSSTDLFVSFLQSGEAIAA